MVSMVGYVALLRRDPGSDFGVDFPDFPGCITAGRTEEEARELAGVALGEHLAGMWADGEPFPEPSTLGAVILDPDNRDATPFLVWGCVP